MSINIFKNSYAPLCTMGKGFLCLKKKKSDFDIQIQLPAFYSVLYLCEFESRLLFYK